jgi:HlyD family secretion protein
MRYAACLALLALLGCSAPENTSWLGYIEGEAVLVAAPQPGWITSMDVFRGSQVNPGDALFTLDATREIAARDSALAAIESAKEQGSQAVAQFANARAVQAQIEADLLRAERELERQRGLVQTGASPRRDLEIAQASRDGLRERRNQALATQTQMSAAQRQAEAQRDAAAATLATAEFNLSQRSVKSLVMGRVQDIYFRQGEYANAGVPVVSILPARNVFVRFFVPEAVVADVQLGQRVHVTCDSCPEDLIGVISFVAAQAEFTPPVIYSVGNRERLVFKVEARFESGLPQRPGLPVEVRRTDDDEIVPVPR